MRWRPWFELLPYARRNMRTTSLLFVLSFACAEAETAPRYAPDGRLLEESTELADWNVLFVSIDTLRADHLGCYGYERETSPRLDALAEEGVVFEEARSASPWTTPAHLSLMTSLYPEAHGVYAYPVPGELDSDVVTLAEALSAQGWATAGFTEGGYAKGATGLDHGFATFPSWPRDEETFVSHELEPSRLEENAERALSWLEEHATERFFLFFHTYEPHYEYRPPAKYVEALAPGLFSAEERASLAAAVERWNRGEPLGSADKGVLTRHYLQGDLFGFELKRLRKLSKVLADFREKEWRDSPGFAEDLAYVTALYDAEILFTDDVVGRLLDALERHGVLDETLVVVTSDHGEGLMDHDEMQHGFHLYEELLHVPLLLRLPGGAHAGARVSAPVRSIDVMPTVLDVLGLPLPIAAQGTSLLPLLEGGGLVAGGFSEALTIQGGERDLLAYRRGRWKLVVDVRDGAERLYDLDADPEERRDVLASTDAALVEELRAELARVLAENAARGARFTTGEGSFSEAERQRLEALGYGGHSEDD